jgi:hypothetical protein
MNVRSGPCSKLSHEAGALLGMLATPPPSLVPQSPLQGPICTRLSEMGAVGALVAGFIAEMKVGRSVLHNIIITVIIATINCSLLPKCYTAVISAVMDEDATSWMIGVYSALTTNHYAMLCCATRLIHRRRRRHRHRHRRRQGYRGDCWEQHYVKGLLGLVTWAADATAIVAALERNTELMTFLIQYSEEEYTQ